MTRVFGYTTCSRPGCEHVVLAEVAYATAGLCTPCWDDASVDRRHVVDVMIEGRTAKMTAKPTKRAHNRKREIKRRGNAAYQARKALAKLAKGRAARRLAALHPAEYLVLLADERSRAGLEPWPAAMAVAFRDACREEGVDPSETLERLNTYHSGHAEAQDVAATRGPGVGTR